ncbi:MAG: hypothetical protein E6G06_16585 [Actinobacteria bacterium]|nr:MAG: hypothetical protein E6G06_16585 [Actinomycetota bacterium]
MTDKRITAERAASIKAGLKDRITRLVNEGMRFKPDHPFGGRGRGFPRGPSGVGHGAAPPGTVTS